MKNNKYTKIFLAIFIVIAFLAIGGYIFNAESFNYKRLFDKKYESELKTADSGDWDSPITRLVGPNPYYVFIGDANNDGYNDIASANVAGSSVSILLWNITSSDWDAQITRSVGFGPMGIFIGDANNDGYNDIATSNSGEFPECTISILLWNITSSDWDSQIVRPVGGSSSYNIFIEDANNDGYNDIVTSNENSNTVSILLWNITSSDWDSQITRSVESGPIGLFIGDANNDGYNDIVTSNVGVETVSILLWNTTSGDWDALISKPARYNPTGVYIGDANNDGYNDIATANEEAGTISILLWNTTSGDWDSQINRQANGPYSIFIEDANNDGYNDIVTANWFYDTVSIILWNTNLGDWDSYITKSVGSNPHGVYVGDANNDGYNDIVTANMDPNTVSIILWNAPPEILINSPNQDDFIGTLAPDFDLSINESSLDTIWYTLDGGLTNQTFVGTLGTINQTAWDALLSGTIVVEFYANDSIGNMGYASVAVNKDIDAPISNIQFIPYSGTDKVIKSTYFTITANDGDGSGIFVIQYNINNTGWIDYTGPFNLSSFEYGNFVISYQAIDNIGNIEDINIILGSLVEETSESPEIPGYNVFLLVGIVGLVSIFLFKKRYKYKIN